MNDVGTADLSCPSLKYMLPCQWYSLRIVLRSVQKIHKLVVLYLLNFQVAFPDVQLRDKLLISSRFWDVFYLIVS